MTTTATTTPQPADLFRHGLRLLLAKDIPGWVDLWDDRGVLEFPFAPDGWPTRLEGKAAVSDYMRHYPDHIDLHDFPDLKIYETGESGTIVVEMRGVGRLVETGAPFDTIYIAVVTVTDGLIVRYRDYWNPLVVSQGGAADFTRSNG